jgi:hypothetical protein
VTFGGNNLSNFFMNTSISWGSTRGFGVGFVSRDIQIIANTIATKATAPTASVSGLDDILEGISISQVQPGTV